MDSDTYNYYKKSYIHYDLQKPRANDYGHPNKVLVELKRGTNIKRPRK